MIITVSKVNSIYLKISCDIGQKMELKEYMSCYVPNYRWNKRFRIKLWDGRVSFFNMQTGYIPTGLLKNFFEFCKHFNYVYTFDFDVKKDLSNEINKQLVEDFCNLLMEPVGIKPHDFQLSSVYKSLTNKRGIINATVGSGKSCCVYMTIRYLLTQNPDRKILLIVPTVSLVIQMVNDFRSYGWKDVDKYVTQLYSGENTDYNKSVLISTWQSSVKKDEEFFKKYDVLMIDEAHLAKSLSISEISKKCINAEYRIGYTGSLPNEKSDLYNIFGYLGQVLVETKTKELMDRDIVSKMKIVNMFLKYPQEAIDKNKNRPYQSEVDFVNEYAPRNDVFRYIFQNTKDGENSLILVTKIDHLKSVVRYLEDNVDTKYKIVYIHGEVKAEEREKIRQSLEVETNIICVATYGTLGLGISVRRLHNICLCASYKSKIKLIQALGRAIRKSEYKKQAILFDLIDDMTYQKRTGTLGTNHLYLHYLERKKYYEEAGFICYDRDFKLK